MDLDCGRGRLKSGIVPHLHKGCDVWTRPIKERGYTAIGVTDVGTSEIVGAEARWCAGKLHRLEGTGDINSRGIDPKDMGRAPW
jgi:hypothetical protein